MWKWYKNIVDVTSFFPSFSATWLPQFIFSLSSSLQFRQLGCHNCFLFRTLPLACTWGTSWAELGQDKNFSNLITEIQFSPPLDTFYFSCNFDNIVVEIQTLSSFCQITLNSTYNNNKLRFLQFLAKRFSEFVIFEGKWKWKFF